MSEMSIAGSEKTVSSYLAWLRKMVSAKKLDSGRCVIDTPFLDRRNDCLQVAVERRDGKLFLHDDGDTFDELWFDGIDFKSQEHRDHLKVTLNGLGVCCDDRRLFVNVPESKAGEGLHSLIQAMLAVEDMYLLARPHLRWTQFSDEVSEYLESKEVRFSPRVILKGKSGSDHAVDCLVPRSREAPECIVMAIDAPNNRTIDYCLYILGDIREARGKGLQAMAVLDDTDKKVKDRFIKTLKANHVEPALWSNKEAIAKQFAA